MLKLQDVSKIYRVGDGFFRALDAVSLEIEQGEMVAVRGRSGAGKSTLLHILGCLDTYEAGDYRIDGVSTRGMRDRQLARIRNAQIGFVLQDFSLIEHKTALYNVMSPLFFAPDVPYTAMKKRAMEALALLHMADQAKKDVTRMSGGQRQRVAIARAIVHDPPILMADEPTGNLDSKTADEIMEVFRMLSEAGKTIILVTHDDTVAARCRRQITLHDGRVTEEHRERP